MAPESLLAFSCCWDQPSVMPAEIGPGHKCFVISLQGAAPSSPDFLLLESAQCVYVSVFKLCFIVMSSPQDAKLLIVASLINLFSLGFRFTVKLILHF